MKLVIYIFLKYQQYKIKYSRKLNRINGQLYSYIHIHMKMQPYNHYINHILLAIYIYIYLYLCVIPLCATFYWHKSKYLHLFRLQRIFA